MKGVNLENYSNGMMNEIIKIYKTGYNSNDMRRLRGRINVEKKVRFEPVNIKSSSSSLTKSFGNLKITSPKRPQNKRQVGTRWNPLVSENRKTISQGRKAGDITYG
jgi:hypothetical protein